MSDAPASNDPIRILDHPAAIEITTRIISDTRQRVLIRSLNLESWLFDHADVMDALRWVATSKRDARVLVLLHDATAPQAAHSKLLELAQRLPSVFEFREVDDPAYREDRTALVSNDVGGYYYRPQGDTAVGTASIDARARVRQLQGKFGEIWERSRLITEYRALGI